MGLLLILMSGCASRREIVQFQQDMDLITNQLIAIQSQNAALNREVDSLHKSVAALKEDNRRTRADILSELTAFREQTANLRYQLDDTGSRMSRLLQNVESGTQPAAPGDSLHNGNSGSPLPAETSDTVQPRALYDAAYLDLSRKSYDLALSGFQEYLRRFPNSELADNALYWTGEIHYVRSEFNRALAAFLKVESEYPSGRKVPAALLKAGYCLQQLGNREGAKSIFERIIRQYPHAEETALARERLQQL